MFFNALQISIVESIEWEGPYLTPWRNLPTQMKPFLERLVRDLLPVIPESPELRDWVSDLVAFCEQPAEEDTETLFRGIWRVPVPEGPVRTAWLAWNYEMLRAVFLV